MDIAVVKARLLESLVRMEAQQDYLPDPASAAQWAAALTPEGSWRDIDFANQEPAAWSPADHLWRTTVMASAMQDAAHACYGDANIHAQALRAFDFWLAGDFHNPNWWWNEIGVPTAIGQLLILLEADLTPARRAKGLEILRRSVWTDWTGQNLFWGVLIQIMRGCLEDDAATVAEAYQRLAHEIRLTPGEDGIQPDFSFYQHGRCFYSGGYGLGFACDGARAAWYAAGTRFALPAEAIDLLSSLVLDGQQWMVYRHLFDFSSVGREIARPGKSARALATACDHLTRLETARRDEFRRFAARIRGEADADTLSGNRHFRCVDFMTHRRPHYYASVRMLSERLDNTDWTCCNEGRKSHHLADGLLYMLRHGEEYTDIFPVWDWRHLPGITVAYAPEPLPVETVRSSGTCAFVGGVSDGEYGLAAMDFARDSLTAHKCWCFFDEIIVCLGAGICSTGDLPVHTVLNQCHLRGPVRFRIADGQAQVARFDAAVETSWVHHDGMGYLLPSPATASLRAMPQQGSWLDIGNQPSELLTMPVFSLWLDHGIHPDAASYAYVVLPDTTPEALDALVAQPQLAILRNTTELQAVWQAEQQLLQAVFWHAGTLIVNDWLTVTVDTPCLLLLRDEPDAYHLSVAEPTGTATQITVMIDATESRRLTVAFPSGSERGKSVSVVLSKRR